VRVVRLTPKPLSKDGEGLVILFPRLGKGQGMGVFEQGIRFVAGIILMNDCEYLLLSVLCDLCGEGFSLEVCG
jgi:hypothetical protein